MKYHLTASQDITKIRSPSLSEMSHLANPIFPTCVLYVHLGQLARVDSPSPSQLISGVGFRVTAEHTAPGANGTRSMLINSQVHRRPCSLNNRLAFSESNDPTVWCLATWLPFACPKCGRQSQMACELDAALIVVLVGCTWSEVRGHSQRGASLWCSDAELGGKMV